MEISAVKYQKVLDTAIKAAIRAGENTYHMENLYALSAIYIHDSRYNFVKWLKAEHADMIKDGILQLPLPDKNINLYHAHVAAYTVFKYAGLHGGLIHSTHAKHLTR